MPDEEQPVVEPQDSEEAADAEVATSTGGAAPSMATIELPELSPTAKEVAQAHLGHLLDVGVEVKAVVGHRSLTLEQIVAIQAGTVIDLEKIAGEPIELQVNNKAFAKAEIVVIEGRLGARITELLDQEEVEASEEPKES